MIAPSPMAGAGRALGRLANSGGPHSRTRKERVSSTVLGNEGGLIRCPLIIRIGLDFAGVLDPAARNKPEALVNAGDFACSPAAVMEELLNQEGFGNPEDLREAFALPATRLVARPAGASFARLDVARGGRRAVLEQALLLGLCTAHLYDAARPVLWTDASLGRALELFDPSGFYA
jgi:hypothetical protein